MNTEDMKIQFSVTKICSLHILELLTEKLKSTEGMDEGSCELAQNIVMLQTAIVAFSHSNDMRTLQYHNEIANQVFRFALNILSDNNEIEFNFSND